VTHIDQTPAVKYPITNYVDCGFLSSLHYAFLTALDTTHDPCTFAGAIKDPKWWHATNLELRALETNGTWDITSIPSGKNNIICKRLFKTKFNVDGSIERHKARLVILGCTQQYGIGY